MSHGGDRWGVSASASRAVGSQAAKSAVYGTLGLPLWIAKPKSLLATEVESGSAGIAASRSPEGEEKCDDLGE